MADGNSIQVVRCLAQCICFKVVDTVPKRTQKNIYTTPFMPSVEA